jgi:hypothetical protein
MIKRTEEERIDLCVYMALQDSDGPEQHFIDLAKGLAHFRPEELRIALDRTRKVIERLQYYDARFLRYGNRMLRKFGQPPVAAGQHAHVSTLTR